jgi:ubiquinone/menaquinone biosynthesis C-methylase UbiE
MADQSIRFDDGAAYERFMGKWSQLAGEAFLDWLAPEPGLGWLDVGCGNGAFTEMLIERCAPVFVQGIDPSEGQLAFARTRPAARMAQFRQGVAMAQPFPDDTFDVAVMPLVIFFVPDPAKGVAEWCGWCVQAALSQPMRGTCMEGFPYEVLQV